MRWERAGLIWMLAAGSGCLGGAAAMPAAALPAMPAAAAPGPSLPVVSNSGEADAFAAWQRRVSYAVRRPIQTHGLILRDFIEMSCGTGRPPSALATYAASADRDAWFDGPFLVVSQGDPLCAEPPLGPARTRLWQGGGQLRVHVACGDPAVNILCGRAALRDFDRFGGTVQARFPRTGVRQGTDVRIDAGGLTLKQVLAVATSLVPVSAP